MQGAFDRGRDGRGICCKTRPLRWHKDAFVHEGLQSPVGIGLDVAGLQKRAHGERLRGLKAKIHVSNLVEQRDLAIRKTDMQSISKREAHQLRPWCLCKKGVRGGRARPRVQ
jgi:hypothetical protein